MHPKQTKQRMKGKNSKTSDVQAQPENPQVEPDNESIKKRKVHLKQFEGRLENQ